MFWLVKSYDFTSQNTILTTLIQIIKPPVVQLRYEFYSYKTNKSYKQKRKHAQAQPKYYIRTLDPKMAHNKNYPIVKPDYPSLPLWNLTATNPPGFISLSLSLSLYSQTP